MQDFVRYKLRILKNAAFKVIFFNSSIDTQSQFDISILNSSTSFPTICVVGGNLNLDAIIPIIEPIIAQATVSGGLTVTEALRTTSSEAAQVLICSGLAITEALSTIVSKIAQAIISVSSVVTIATENITGISVDQTVSITNDILVDATTKIEKEFNVALVAATDIDATLNATTAQLLSAISAGIIDVNSDSIISLPNPLTTSCVFASTVTNEVRVQEPNAALADSEYAATIAANADIETAIPAINSHPIEMVFDCTLRTAHIARIEEYDASDLTLLDNSSLLDLGFYMNFTY